VARYGAREGVEEFHWLEGLSLERMSERKAAQDRALAARPRFPLALYARAWAGGGVADYEAAIAAAPDFAEAYIFRGSHRLSVGDAAGATADFERLMALGVHLAPAYNGRAGVRLRLLKDYDGAIADATETIRIRPKDYHLPWMYRGEARFAKGDWAGAIEDFTRSRDIVPESAEKKKLLAWRGRAKAAAGDLEGARADLRDAGAAGEPFLRDLR
jgi:tetratricopeptide (TPR) repeat protein